MSWIEHLEMGWLTDDGNYICDGCAVRPGHEHRCHKDDGVWADARQVCSCEECVGPVDPRDQAIDILVAGLYNKLDLGNADDPLAIRHMVAEGLLNLLLGSGAVVLANEYEQVQRIKWPDTWEPLYRRKEL